MSDTYIDILAEDSNAEFIISAMVKVENKDVDAIKIVAKNVKQCKKDYNFPLYIGQHSP